MKKYVLLPQMTFKYIKVTDGYQSYCKSHSVLPPPLPLPRDRGGGWGGWGWNDDFCVISHAWGGWAATVKLQEPGWGHIRGGGGGGAEMILGSQADGGTALS